MASVNWSNELLFDMKPPATYASPLESMAIELAQSWSPPPAETAHFHSEPESFATKMSLALPIVT